MAIRGLEPATMSAFVGKNTAQNMTSAAPNTMLSAKNVLVLADNQVRRAPGYTLVAKVGTGPVLSEFNFERNVDQTQHVFVQSGTELWVMNADGTGQVRLSTGEDPAAEFAWIQNSFIAYASNGIVAYRFCDVAGVLTKYQWGISAPATAPAISVGAGTLTLAFGRQYVYCYVSKYTDSLGIERVSVGPPSPISAHSGPITGQIVELSTIAASADPQVNFVWVFETSDAPLNTSATFYFAAEIPNGQTSYGDALADANLDQTRLAPFDNNPAPPSPMLTTFQSSVAAVNGAQIRLSGTDLVVLGIPEEAFPLSLFFNVPSGSRQATAVISPDAGTSLVVDTADSKFLYTGYDASTFTEQDSVASPGTVGKNAQCQTPFGTAYLSQSQRIWMWRVGGTPTEISGDVAQAYAGTYGMQDLSVADLPNARLLWYSFGRVHFLAVIARTNDAPDKYANLIQLWSIPVKGSQSSGEYTGSSSFFNQIGGMYQTDKIPGVSISSAAVVKVGNQPFLYLGDATGNVYRFPDGYQDNGAPYPSSFSSPWTLLGYEGRKRFYWIDLIVESPSTLDALGGPVANFQVFAAVSESGVDQPRWIPLQLTVVPVSNGPSPYALRGNLQVQGLNTGKYIRFSFVTPSDANDEVLLKTDVWHAPLYMAVP